MISKHVERMETKLKKLDMIHELLGHEIEEARAAISELKAELAGNVQQDLGLEGDTAVPANRPAPAGKPVNPSAETYLCTCGHERIAHAGQVGHCSHHGCTCAQFFPRKEVPAAPASELDPDEMCACGHTRQWHQGKDGTGFCHGRNSQEADDDCDCKGFRAK